MRAMILAAGRGKRMGALTDDCPKPLLKIGDLTLIEWQVSRLAANGFTEIVINVGYLGDQIVHLLGEGDKYGVSILYSREPSEGLETGGGVFQALPTLGSEPFLLTNADVFCDFPYRTLSSFKPNSFHAVLVKNPDFKVIGDFCLRDGYLQRGGSYTFSGISVINPQLFENSVEGFYPIAPLFYDSIDRGVATGEYYSGDWFDVGTPERLSIVRKMCG
ncbi:MAG: nucleotidyltransferase family protein [Gammaproteobacteria bacterium]|nr:nucleotidyltransferase family protein [Gammaproteobacteria bacterium]